MDDLSGVARHGGSALADGPALLRRVLETEAWREFITQRGDHVQHSSFAEFVSTPPLKGLGADMAVIDRIIGTGDPDLLRMLRKAKAVGQGHRSDLSPTDESSRSGVDRQSAKTADRLAREAPEQYEAVRSGELSLNAAAVLAGIRPRRISVRTDNPASVAQSLRKHFTAEQLAELIALLLTGDDP